MKKQLLLKPLLALALVLVCGNVWGDGTTYTAKYVVSTITAVLQNDGSSNYPIGSEATYESTYNSAKQLTKGNSMSLSLSGYDNLKITGITLSMKSNSKGGAGYLDVKAGTTTIASIGTNSSGVAFDDARWNGSFSTSYVNVDPSVTQYIVQEGENIVITIGATVNSLYCESFTITYEASSSSEQYEVTIESPTNGALVVKQNGTTVTSGDKFIEGTKFTIETTPATGYKLSNWQAVDQTTHTYTTTFEYTMGKNDVTFKANFDTMQSYELTYNSRGSQYGTTLTLYENEGVVFPENPELPGYAFVGWTTSKDVEPGVAPTFFSEGTKLTSNTTLYAVFAKEHQGSDQTEELENSEIQSLSSSKALAYATETKYTDNEINYSIYGYTDGSRPWVQLKKDEGVYVKISAPSSIVKVDVTITSASNSSGGSNDISKHTAFGGMVALTESDCAFTTSSAAIAYTESISQHAATLTPSKNVSEAYLKVSTGARIWGITVTYGIPATYSNYTTDYYQSEKVDITSVGQATACVDFDATVSGATAYYINTVTNSSAKLTPVSGVIPAGTGVLLKTDDGQSGTATFEENYADADAKAAAADNMLKGSIAGETFSATGFTYYILSNGSNGVGFYWDPNTENEGQSANCAAGKAVLAVPGASSSNVIRIEGTTGIDTIEAAEEPSVIYDLTGRQVKAATNGIYIVNGKKMIIK